MKSKRLHVDRFTWMLLITILVLLALAIIPHVFQFEGDLAIALIVPAALIALGVGLLAVRRMNHRLAEMGAVAAALEKGDYSARCKGTESDAIGRLARTINSMAETIQRSIRALEVHQHDLEQSRRLLAEQNVKLEQEFHRRSGFGEYLAALHTVDAYSVADQALTYMMTEAGQQLGIFYLFDKASEQLLTLAQQGIDPQAVQAMTALSTAGEGGLPLQVARERRWVIISNIDAEALPQVNLGFADAHVQNVVGIPVMFGEEVLGVLVLASLRQFDETTRRLLDSAVEAMGNALNSALTYQTVQDQARQLEQANMELLEADRLRSEFVANMSHELRTPLNSIIGFSGLLLKNRQQTLGGTDLNYAEKIHRNGKHLLSLINDILDLSKIEACKMDLLLTETHVDAVVREVVDLLRPQADEKNLELRFEDATQEPPIIRTDSEKFRRVLINLLGNALKFTHQGGVTVLLAGTDHGTLEVSVRDTGIGIPEEKLAAIFEPFRQVDSSTSRHYGGTGLGLTITRSILETLHGAITVASTPGEGSTFTVTLPFTTSQPGSYFEEPQRHEVLRNVH